MSRIAFSCILFVSYGLLLISCKKEQELDTCNDGLLSSGEIGVDCGGVCLPCTTTGNSNQEILLVKLNGFQMQFSNKSLMYSDGWVFRFWNDTLDIRLNIGEIEQLGAQSILQLNSSVYSNSLDYEELNNGYVLISQINQIENRLSGYFEAKFVGYFADSMIVDTFYIQNGDFENILMTE